MADMTIQEAADTLGVSLLFVEKQIDEGSLPFHTIESQRRVRIDDLMAFKDRIDTARQKTLDELTEVSQRLGVGY